MAFYSPFYNHEQSRYCGCWYPVQVDGQVRRNYLAKTQLTSKTTILALTSRTTLQQTFTNTHAKDLDEVQYTFPLYDGVSVASFSCTVAGRTIVGVVKAKEQARADYQEAVARGETAALLEQLPEASDVFTTSIGNVPSEGDVHVEIVYFGELKHDAETGGSRFTIPVNIAPRYGSLSTASVEGLNAASIPGDCLVELSVDVTLAEGTAVRGIQSPSHPIAVTMGRTSIMDVDSFTTNSASATLTLGAAHLETDFVIIVLAKESDTPRALLETYSGLPNRRAIMATLVPRFNLPSISPEIVFVVDRSGSMEGKISLLVSALKVFLKSLPVGVKFNICSFGSSHSFLFDRSKTYDQYSLREALQAVDSFKADFGGTEMLQPIVHVVQNRYSDLALEVMVLTDGQIWNQAELFTYIRKTDNARFFTLGIGAGASSALVEGIARAGNGFAQSVAENEKLDRRVVRMLKGALTPHVTDYALSVKYDEDHSVSASDDFEMVENNETNETVTDPPAAQPAVTESISLFDTNATEEMTTGLPGRYDHLPTLQIPKVLQAPSKIPSLFPFNRSTVYLLLGPDSPDRNPLAITLRGTSEYGPLELEIPIQHVGSGRTLSQLAARKAVQELEEGGGWISDIIDSQGRPLKSTHEGRWDLVVEREAIRLGEEYQVVGKWSSFVAVHENSGDEVRTSPRTTNRPVLGSTRKKKARSGFSVPSPAASFTSTAFAARASTSVGAPSLFGGCASPNAVPAAFGASMPAAAPSGAFGKFAAFGQSKIKAFGASSFVSSRPAPPMFARQALPPPGSSPTAGGLFGSVAPQSDRGRDQSVGTDGALSSPMQVASSTTPHYTPAPAPAPRLADKDEEEHEDQEWLEPGPGTETTRLSSENNNEKMHRVIGLQEFDGHWDQSDELWALLDIQIRSGVPSEMNEKSKCAVATSYAMAWLKKIMAEEEDVWNMVYDKALGWLETTLGKQEASKAVEQAADMF